MLRNIFMSGLPSLTADPWFDVPVTSFPPFADVLPSAPLLWGRRLGVPEVEMPKPTPAICITRFSISPSGGAPPVFPCVAGTG